MRDFDSSTIRWRFIALVATIVVSGSALMAGAPQATPPPKPKPAAPAPMVDPMPPGASIYLSIVDVKPESWEDYVALQKSEAIPGLQKGGRASRQAWRSQSFGQSYEVAYLYPVKSWADRRRATVAEGARRGRREGLQREIRPMVDGSHYYALRARPDLGFVADQSAHPKFGILTGIRVIPGKQAASNRY